jgi:uncharacterized protein YdeI (YjbR/CyaY-like superfamily)
MIAAADELRFEYAAQVRDEIRELRRELRDVQAVEASGGEIDDAKMGDGTEGGVPETVETSSGEVA